RPGPAETPALKLSSSSSAGCAGNGKSPAPNTPVSAGFPGRPDRSRNAPSTPSCPTWPNFSPLRNPSSFFSVPPSVTPPCLRGELLSPGEPAGKDNRCTPPLTPDDDLIECRDG